MEEKILIRNEIGIPKEAFVFAYSGQFITRKNIPFLLKNFSEVYKNDNTTYLILLGNGTLLDELKNEYNKFNNIVFYGNVDNVNYYLKAADVYVSTSKSEGLPNGVLEAMAAKLPVLLSDIEQHKEIFETGNNIGEIYSLNNDNEFKDKLEILRKTDINIISENSLNVVKNNYTDVIMSKKYQEVYKNIIEKEK